MRPHEFYEHALAIADRDRRLPLSRMTGWEISPFEQEGLKVAQLRAPVIPEPSRHDEDASDCNSCRRRDEGIWLNDHWRITRVAGTGVPLVLMLHPRDHFDLPDLPDERAAELGLLTSHIARAHAYRIGDGGAHLHVWFFARPAGQSQLYGSWMVVWDDLLPEYPSDVADVDAAAVATDLIRSFGGWRSEG